MTIRHPSSSSLNTSPKASGKALAGRMAAIAADSIARIKVGQRCFISAPAGGKLEAIYDGVDFVSKSGFISHRIKVRLPSTYSKSDYRRATWYVPSSRFV